VREGREIMETKIVSNIKRIEGECGEKLCEDSVRVWTEFVEEPKMKAIEAKLREEQEHAKSDRKGCYTSTSGVYGNHFSLEVGICIS
jgi:hypothetical protein